MTFPKAVAVLVSVAGVVAVLNACGDETPTAAVRATGAVVTTTVAGGGDATSAPGASSSAPPASTAGQPPRSATTAVPGGPAGRVVGTTIPVATVPPYGTGSGANRVQVVPGAVDLRARPFESAAPSGERQVAVRFYSGVAPCDVVGRVDVAEAPDHVTITLFSGHDASARERVCIELAVYNEILVDLPSPLAGRRIVDGAA